MSSRKRCQSNQIWYRATSNTILFIYLFLFFGHISGVIIFDLMDAQEADCWVRTEALFLGRYRQFLANNAKEMSDFNEVFLLLKVTTSNQI